MSLKKSLKDKVDLIRKILDPDYFLCLKCNEYKHVSIRCKQKLFGIGNAPGRIVPSKHPLCIPCNGGQEWWEWKVKMEKDIVALYGIDMDKELVSVSGEQIEAELSELK